ncbi:MAG TPA: VCBS repeat-containing protein, partial [Gemmataceae bacterium]|nr:VCBS repeat-containing protein [Gemmataceae bacterium]
GDGLPDLLLATPSGPRLFVNLGKGQFKDETRRLPREAFYNLTAAAWGDFDGDGKPDILLANGFHGLRLYRNGRTDSEPKYITPKFGDWYAIGIFRAPDQSKNFETAFPVETEKFNPTKEYKGKRDLPTKWEKKDFKAGEPNPIPEVGQNCATYVYREMEVPAATDLPVSIGSGNTLTVWVNGEKIHSDATHRTEPALLSLRLKPGKNTLLVKMCNTDQPQSFSFAIGHAEGPGGPWFEDVSAAWGLGPDGMASDVKGDTLAVADFNGDGRPDFLYGAGSGMLFLNVGGKFALKADSGISYKPGKVGPALCDFDGDGHVDLFVPQIDGQCRLFRNNGNGTFTNVAPSAGDLGKPIPGAVSAAWGDFDNDGRPDLLVCCLRGPNRYFHSNPDGTFSEKTAELGLTQKVFNSQAAGFADLNGDGQLDLILNNEGQDSAILFGVAGNANGKTPVLVNLNGTPALNGGKVVVRDAAGKPVASSCVFGGDGRGGQAGLAPRFVLAPGAYKVEVVSTDGKATVTDLTVAASPMSVKLQ